MSLEIRKATPPPLPGTSEHALTCTNCYADKTSYGEKLPPPYQARVNVNDNSPAKALPQRVLFRAVFVRLPNYYGFELNIARGILFH